MDENNKDDVIKNNQNIEEIKKDAVPNLADNITSKPDSRPVDNTTSKTEPQLATNTVTENRVNIEPTPKPEANSTTQPAPQVVKEEQSVQKQEKANNNNATVNQQPKDKKGFSIAALVLGIVAIVLCCVCYISIPCGILAIVFGAIGVKSSKRGMSISGIVTGIIGMIISICIILMLVIFGFAIGITESIKDIIDDNNYSDFYDYDYDYDSFYNF